jgi:hypothetical protein
VVPSVKVLALKVRFRVAEEVRTLLAFLKCFPEVETLHVMAVSSYDCSFMHSQFASSTTAIFIAPVPSFAELHLRVYFLQSDNDTDYYDDPGEVEDGDKLNSTFWQEVGPIKCVQSHVKKVVIDQFSGGTNQVEFLKLVLGRAVLLQKVIIVLAGPDPIKVSEVTHKLQPLASKKMWATKVLDTTSLEVCGRASGHIWRYSRASDLSISDPFIS